MGAREFGQLIGERLEELKRLDPQAKWSQSKVARRFGELPDGRGLDSTQVRLLLEGQRRLDHALVERLIAVLGLNENPTRELQAWKAAGLWPEHLEPGDLGGASEPPATRVMATHRVAPRVEGATVAAVPSATTPPPLSTVPRAIEKSADSDWALRVPAEFTQMAYPTRRP